MKNHVRPDVPMEIWCETWIAPMIPMMPCAALDPVIAKAVQIRPQTLSFIVNICSDEVCRGNVSFLK
jgi:hypothetical protein